MDITSAPGIASLATSMSNAKLESDVGVAVLKKALDLNAETANQLVQAIPSPTPSASGTLGSTIDIMA